MPTRSKLNPAQRKLLSSQPIARLATSTASGEPSLVPITFILSDDRILIVIDDKPKSGKTLRRVQNIRDNNSVAVLIDHYEDEWTALWWLLIRGAGEILEFEEFSEQQQLKIPSTFKKKYRQYKELSFADRTFISITIEVVSSWRFDSA